MKKQTLKKYITFKSLVGYGIINGIVNVGIFYALEGKHTGALFSTKDIMGDLAGVVSILGVILAWLVPMLTKLDVKGGHVEMPKDYINKVASKLPDKKGGYILTVGAITTAIVLAVMGVIVAGLSALKMIPLSLHGMAILKGIACSIGGMIAGYLSVTYSLMKISDKTIDINESVKKDKAVV